MIPNLSVLWVFTIYSSIPVLGIVVNPALGIGGAVQIVSKDGILLQLDNGYLCRLQSNTTSSHTPFYSQARSFLKNAKPLVQNDLLEAHFTVALYSHDYFLKQICYQQLQLHHIIQWMIQTFPDNSAQWVHPTLGHHINILGDGILICQCATLLDPQIH